MVPIRLSGREVLIAENIYSGDVKCSETGNEEYFPPGAGVHIDPRPISAEGAKGSVVWLWHTRRFM